MSSKLYGRKRHCQDLLDIRLQNHYGVKNFVLDTTEKKPLCIDIQELKNVVLISFSGNSDNRKLWLKYVKGFFIPRLSRYSNYVAVFTILYEIIKNIYDHAGGKGVLSMVDRGDFLYFSIADENTKRFNLKLWDMPTYSSGKNGVNQSPGKRLIRQLAVPDSLIFDFEMDTSKGGISYHFKMKKELKKQK